MEPDIDYKPNEMTKEQREVFEALEYNGEDDAYEQLEDNFLEIALAGQSAIIKDENNFTIEKKPEPVVKNLLNN